MTCPNHTKTHRRYSLLLTLTLLCGFDAAAAEPAASPYLEELTWTELRDQLKAGTTTVLIPVGGTEQNGPHIVLGKHNVRVRALAGLIAKRLSHAVVAPVMAYVPQGNINPPAGHMRFTGTISISDTAFESALESTARSFCQHGFRDVVFLGDHGSYQKNLGHVAAKLNREWATPASCRAHALLDYYRAAQAGHAELLQAKGYSVNEIGTHAGLADTALSMAVDPSLVRTERAKTTPPQATEGVYGDPRRATAELGQLGVNRVVEISVQRLREWLRTQ
jgi:creatinine amidohydrolase